MKTAEQHAKPVSTPKVAGVAVLADMLRREGSGTSLLRRLSLLVTVTAAILALAASSALAAPPASFGEPGEGAGQIANVIGNAQGIAIEQESGDVYINDGFNSRADKFGPEGEFLLSFGWGVVDGAAELQVCGPDAIVSTLTCRTGILDESSPGPGQFGLGPAGIAVDNSGVLGQQGDVYVQDSPGRVTKFGPHGEFLLMIGGGVDKGSHHPGNLCTAAFIAEGDTCGAATPGTGPREFEELRGNPLAVGPGGTLYVGDKGRIQKFSPTGAVEGEISLPGVVAEQIAVDSAGDIYVAGEKLNGVHKYDSAGTELGAPRDPAFRSTNSVLAIGPSDELFVLGAEGLESANRIDLFDASGKQLSTFLNEIQGSGRINSRGIVYGNKIERLYLLDGDHAQVDLMSPPAPGPLLLPRTTEAKEIRKTHAVLCAEVNPEGKATTVHFDYLSEAKYKQDGEAFGAGTQETTESASIGEDFEFHDACQQATGLSSATAYRFRIIASNENGPPAGVLGEAAGFETQPPFAIDATFSAEVSATTATVGAEINPLGEPVTYHFEYDTVPYSQGEGPHGTVVPVTDASAGSGEADVTRTTILQGLTPDTTYHYRVVARNALAMIAGPDATFTTQAGATTTLLSDGRAWELVSPPNKHGAPLEAMTNTGGAIQAAADGSALAYIANGPATGAEAEGSRSLLPSQLLSERQGSGVWSTRDISTPRKMPSGIVYPGTKSEFKFFSPDLSSSAVEPEGATPLSPSAPASLTPYVRSDFAGAGFCTESCYRPLVTGCPAEPEPCSPAVEAAANVPAGTKFGVIALDEVRFIVGTRDLSHILLASSAALVEGFENNGKEALYEWTDGNLVPVSVLPNGTPLRPASIGGTTSGGVARNVISSDGSRVVFQGASAGVSNNLYLRVNATAQQSSSGACDEPGMACTIPLDAPQGGSGTGGGGEFQIASADDSRIFFTDEQKLTANSSAHGRDLYMCQIEEKEGHLACVLTDISANTLDPAEPADVLGDVVGAPTDGSSVYFVAQGALTAGESAVHGNCEQGEHDDEGSGLCNLYRYDVATQSTQLVAVLSGADKNAWSEFSPSDLSQFAARVSPGGDYLAFMSERSLTGYDNRDAVSGVRDREVYLYDAVAEGGRGKLVCASCNPTGARPHGTLDRQQETLADHPDVWTGATLAASIPGWTVVGGGTALYQSRYLSDSGRLFFNAADALVPSDTNGTEDVYEFEFPHGSGQAASDACATSSSTYSFRSDGCISLVSSGTSREESAFLDASESGDDVFFLTAAKLVSKDVDSSLDVYDARVGGGEPEQVNPPACEGDACQGPASAPEDPTPGSLTFQGPGNLLPPVASAPVVKTKSLTRAQKLRRALRACKKKRESKRVVCERQARARYGAVKSSKDGIKKKGGGR